MAETTSSSSYGLYWGDTHTNLHSRHLDQLDVTVRYAKEMLDFWPIAYYPQEMSDTPEGVSVEDWLPPERLEREWRLICDCAAASHVPGEFVPFAGYEWQGDGSSGDHNVFYLEDHAPLLTCATLRELYDEIRRRGLASFAIPHHTAYMVGIRAKDWSVQDDEISPFAEIFSCHGCSESDEEWIGLRRNRHMGPGVSGGTIEDGLDLGHRFGIICSGDSHSGFAGVYGHGLMGCYAKELTRQSLWEAFAARRVYGVSADRMALEFTANDAMMGSVIESGDAVLCRTRVRGGDAIDRIELLRNNRVIATHCHNGAWAPPADGVIRCKLRVEVGWGGDARIFPKGGTREWDGALEAPSGRIVSVEKCWRSAGQSVEAPGGARCGFHFATAQGGMGGRLPNEANIFEIEGRPSDAIVLTVEGKRVEMTLGEAMAGSRMIHFIDESERFVREKHGIDPSTLPRRDRLYYMGHKVKVHRAIPEVGYTAELVCEDKQPPAGANHYRVRVTQRNGDVGWTSPVWVEQG